ncbi:MAG: type II toxin-antitoxin system VapC family toxin [Coxiellaceae bacterium]|nr:type II toxin-antitoxin system VapC family toxin [Coxiellaceae bacterium]
MKDYLLDTHAWLWYVVGDKAVSIANRKLLESAAQENRLYMAAISLWEIAMLEKKSRITLERETLEWVQDSLALSHVEMIELTPSIAVESARLPGEFHGDPADRLIVATARIKGFTLLTRDKRIIEYAKSDYLSAIKI